MLCEFLLHRKVALLTFEPNPLFKAQHGADSSKKAASAAPGQGLLPSFLYTPVGLGVSPTSHTLVTCLRPIASGGEPRP